MDKESQGKMASPFQYSFSFIQSRDVNLSSVFEGRLEEHLLATGVRKATVREKEKMEKQSSHCAPQTIKLICRHCERLFPTLESRAWLE